MTKHYGVRPGEKMRYPEDYARPEKFLPIESSQFDPEHGTLMYNGSAYVYSSQEGWKSPWHGYEAHKHMWLWLGSPGWFAHEEIKQMYEALERRIGKRNMPGHQREYILLSGV